MKNEAVIIAIVTGVFSVATTWLTVSHAKDNELSELKKSTTAQLEELRIELQKRQMEKGQRHLDEVFSAGVYLGAALHWAGENRFSDAKENLSGALSSAKGSRIIGDGGVGQIQTAFDGPPEKIFERSRQAIAQIQGELRGKE